MIKTVGYPLAFEKFLEADDDSIQEHILEASHEKQRLIEERFDKLCAEFGM